MIELGSIATFPDYQSNACMSNSLVGSLYALDAASETDSEPSTLSSSPTSTTGSGIAEATLDEALLREKFAKLGIDLNADLSPPRISVHNSSDESGSDSSDEPDEPAPRTPLIRSTSLKTGKTPPSTPRRKKFVRFADSLGLDLAAVRHILQDDLPHVPATAYVDLKVPKDWLPSSRPAAPAPAPIFTRQPQPAEQRPDSWEKALPPWLALYQQQTRSTLIPEFIEPFVQMNFLDRVRQQHVCLENCYISSGAGSISVTCVVRVVNISFEKQVLLRFTVNEWSTWTDCLASYIPNSSDGWSDRFTATFHVSTATGGNLTPGQRVLFAVKYIANNEEFWDNNMGLNYSLIYRV